MQTTIQCPRCCGTGHIQNDVAVGAELRQERETAGLSLREVARRMRVSATYTSELERGGKHWSEGRIEAYRAALAK